MKRFALVLLLSGCGNVDQGTELVREPEVDVYTTHLHPYLEASCATLECHGDEGRPLRLFAETGLRLTDDLRDQPITEEELLLDAESLLGLDPASGPDDSLVVLKPLAESAGGVGHVGHDIIPSRDDDAYLCLVRYLEGGPFDETFDDACARAIDAVALPPKED